MEVIGKGEGDVKWKRRVDLLLDKFTETNGMLRLLPSSKIRVSVETTKKLKLNLLQRPNYGGYLGNFPLSF